MNLSIARLRPVLLYLTGVFFLYFSNGSHAQAVAAWVALPCFLLITRTLSPWRAYALMAVTFGVVTQASLWHFAAQDAGQPLHYLPLAAGLLFGLPYALDAMVMQRFQRQKAAPAGWQTLFFPLAYTCLEYAVGSLNPLGTMGTLPYSQLDFLALAQLASVTGIWGLTFLITWFGSVLAYVLTNYASGQPVGRVAGVYAAVWLAVVSFGGWRLVQPAPPDSVRVAGIHVDDRAGLNRLWQLYGANPTAFRAEAARLTAQLMAETRQQARAGAEVVIWSEGSLPVLPADEPRLLDSLKNLARKTGIYLVASPFVYFHPARKDQNKLWLVDPSGQLRFTHVKYGGNLIEGCELGNQRLQVADTPLGRLSGVICWDSDFPATIRQLSALRVGLLLSPAADWREISPLHTVVAQFRGIENGCSVVRQTLAGRSVMADPYGRVLVRMDHFETRRWVMQGQVPTRSVWTVYGWLGDWFGWGCVLGLAVLAGVWFRWHR